MWENCEKLQTQNQKKEISSFPQDLFFVWNGNDVRKRSKCQSQGYILWRKFQLKAEFFRRKYDRQARKCVTEVKIVEIKVNEKNKKSRQTPLPKRLHSLKLSYAQRGQCK